MKPKTTKKQLTQKYLLFIIISISLFYLMSCQKEPSRTTSVKIVYTDIIPDTIVVTIGTTPIYNLDLDKDGVYDFTFKCTYGRTQCRPTGGYGFKIYIEVEPADNSFNEILNVVYPALPDTVPAALDTLNEIGSVSGEWLSSPSQLLRYENSCCCDRGDYFFDNNDKYLGLKLVKGGQAFYGWARLNGKIGWDGTPLLLKDYAYNSSPNEFILAGQTK